MLLNILNVFNITYMWNIKKGTNEFFLIGQKEIHRCRKQTYGYQKGKVRGGIN